MSAPDKIYVDVDMLNSTFVNPVSLHDTGFVSYTRTDLCQAAVASALEAAANAAWLAGPSQDLSHEELSDVGKERRATALQCEAAIRALITTDQRDALAAHVAAEVAKARSEDADLLYNAWLGLRVLENIAKVKGLSGAADVTTPLLAEIEAAHPEFAPRSALRAQIGAKP